MDQVVVIGGGFGGLAAVRALADVPVHVTLVDQRNYHTFLPLLYQVATAGLNPADVAHPTRAIFRRQRNVTVRQGSAVGVDWDDRRVEVALADGTVQQLPFDHLVVAAGSRTNFFGVEGAEEWSFPLYSLDDATTLRNHLLGRFEASDADSSLIDEGALTVVVVGAGPTGVELAGALTELFHGVLRRDFTALDVSRARVVLVEMLDHVLPPFESVSRWYARDALRDRGVELVLGDSVARVDEHSVTLASGRVVPTHTLVWAAGVQASPFAGAIGVPVGRGGRIEVDDHLRVPDRDGVYAVGDIAAVPSTDGGVLPLLAPVAMQSGKHAAAAIAHEIGVRDEPGAFRYVDRGTMATIGRRSAVAELPYGIRLRGTLAWAAWLVLHLWTLIGFRNRLSVLLNWSWNYLTWDRGARLILGASRRRGFGPDPVERPPQADHGFDETGRVTGGEREA
jgi:NADH:ubiquinone reductase (H+-translocating)